MKEEKLQLVTYEQKKILKNRGFEWEDWRNIPGYEGLYQVSSFGRIKRIANSRYNSLTKSFNKKEYILSTPVNDKGYSTANLYKNGKASPVRIHRLVAEVFMPNNENKPEVNHINGIKSDNQLNNLEWATRSENQKHAFANGLNKPNRINKGKFRGEHTRARKIVEVDNKGNVLQNFSCLKDATIFYNLSAGEVSRVCSGKANHSHNHYFKYA
jgi:hypothetical protein